MVAQSAKNRPIWSHWREDEVTKNKKKGEKDVYSFYRLR